jgi:HSP20 family protein
MNIIRWDPFRELEEMAERLNRLFPRPSPRAETGRESLTVPDWVPAVDIAETAEEYLVKAELPEVKKDDVRVSFEDGVLTIEGERRQEKEEKGRKFHRVERSYGRFLRSFRVPDEVDGARIRAEFKDGVLAVHLPKSEKAKPKAVEIKVA